MESILPTEEEMELIQDYIILPTMLTIATKSISEVEKSTHPIRRIYAAAGEALLELIHADLARTRRELREKGIRIYGDQRTSAMTYGYQYTYRGYHHDFELARSLMRVVISDRLTAYLKQMYGGGG